MTAGDRRMRVLHVAQPVDGGVATVVAQYAADQVARGWEVCVACPSGGTLAATVGSAGARWEPWPAVRGPRAGSPEQVRRLRALVRRVRPDVVHLHSASAGLTGRLAVHRTRPTLFQPHGWSWQAVDGAMARATKVWEWAGQLLCHRIVCVSEAERRNCRRAGIRRAADVIPNGVDLRRFRPAAEPGAARVALGLPDLPTAVCVGRLDAQKGQQVLVRCWAEVCRQVPAVLVLVGDGPERERLTQLSAELGVASAVVFAGTQTDIGRWYAAADVVAFSSLHGEAMALTPLEAQACGRPVVASDVAGVRESCAPSAGAVVPAADVAAFARELAGRLVDPELARREGALARAHAEQHLDVRQSLDRLAELTLGLRRTGGASGFRSAS